MITGTGVPPRMTLAHRVYSSAMAATTMMSSQLVRLGFPLFEQMFCQVDPSFVKENLFPLSFSGIAQGAFWQHARQIIRKASLLGRRRDRADPFLCV